MSSDRRTHIAQEIQSTERTFVKNLKTVVEVYLLPLRMAIDDGKPIIKQRNIEQIFSNIEEIMRVSVQFLFLVEQRVEKWNDNPCIGDVFMEVISEFYVYDKYLMDHHRAIVKVTELERRGPFAQFMETAKIRPECEGLGVLALLITPVQRILRYKLFLEDLMKCTPETHPDHKNLSLALAAVLEKAAAVNASIKAAENYEKLCQIQKSFITQSGNVKNLVVEDRLFIREGNLTKVCRKTPKKRWFFLFSDILIYASATQSGVAGTLYSFHRMFQLSKTKIKTIADTDTQKNAFQIITNDKSFTVFADTPEEKDLWLQDFAKATASKSAIDASAEDASAPVWVPDTNGVVCRLCSGAFTWVNRRHHCRQCGNLVCGACSTGRAILAHTADTKPVRVCDECSPPAVLSSQATATISAPTFSYGTSEHAVISQIMKDTTALSGPPGAQLSRAPSRSGLKPPSNPLPPTPIQMSTTPPATPNPALAKKPIPTTPSGVPILKRANTINTHSPDSAVVPPLPPKPAATPSRVGTVYNIAPTQGTQESGESLETEVQILLNNLQNMLKTESQTSNLSLIERVRFFSNKINEHNLKYNVPPSGPPPSPPTSASPVNPPFGNTAKLKPNPSNPNASRALPVTGGAPRVHSAGESADATPQAPTRPVSIITKPPAAAIMKPNGAIALPVVPPRKANPLRKTSPNGSLSSTSAAAILVDTSRT